MGRRSSARAASRKAGGKPAKLGGKPAKRGGKPAAAERFGPTLLGIGALALVVVAAYFPALSAGFIWDDRAFTDAPPVRDANGIWRIWFSPGEIEGEGHYWPLTYTTFWLEHRLWGSFWAPGFHAVNLLLHFVNAGLAWHLLRRLGALPMWWAWAVAALFAVHPVHVEAVAWVIGRKDLLATLFYFCTALAWLRALEAGTPRWSWHLFALVLFAAGLLCKSIGITLPVALLVLRWWQQDRLTVGDCWRVLPFFIVAVGIGVADTRYYEEIIDVDYTFLERVLIAAQSLWFYLGKLLWPANLMPVYPHWRVDVAAALPWACMLGALAVAGALWFLRGRIGRGPLAGAAFFALTLSPVLGLVPFGYMQFAFVANRYQYLADVGALAVLVGAVYMVVGAFRKEVRWAAAGVATALLITLGTLTWQHAGIHRNEIVFFEEMIAANPTARDAHFNLGNALFRAGRREEGLAAALTSLTLRPDSMKAQYGVGVMLHELGRSDEALQHLQRALAINANNHIVQYMTGQVLRALGRNDEAEAHFRRTLAIQPRHWGAHANLATLLAGTNRVAAAADLMRQALTLWPGRPNALLLLASLEFNQQRYREALDLYRAAQEQLPNNAVAWSGSAAALHELGRPVEALRDVDRALAIDPALADARNNRAVIAAAARAAQER